MRRSWDGPQRMSTRSPAGAWSDAQASARGGNGPSTERGAGAASGVGAVGAVGADLQELLARSTGNTIHVHVNCSSGGDAGACGAGPYGGAYTAAFPSFVPTLPGLWPLPPASFGGCGAQLPPGLVLGCAPGPVLLPPMAGALPGWAPTGWR